MSQDLTRDDVVLAVEGCHDFRLRSGVEEVFQIAYKHGIPVVVLSAGLGNIIEEIIRQRIRKPSGEVGTPWKNVRVLSNTLLWNSNGHHQGFTEPLIHMFNKGLRDAPSEIKELLRGRNVGVLSGDGLGDLTMADGHPTTILLKFGFLNQNTDERMGQFCSETAFDRVVLNDGTYEPLLEVLRQL